MNRGLHNNASASSLTNYAVPSTDGKLIPAIPEKLAIKFKPPTIAVVYTMSHSKKRSKKYIHDIKIFFDEEQKAAGLASPHKIDLKKMCDQICRKEPIYLNSTYISAH